MRLRLNQSEIRIWLYCDEMGSSFDMLSDVIPGRDSWNFRVRVLRMWPVHSFMSPGEVNGLEMVLIDEKGGKIHASIRKQLLYLFDKKINEGDVYKLSHFAVAPSVGGYRPTLHPYKLVFQMKTKVQICDGPDIPSFGFNFTDLDVVSSYTADFGFLLDVMGVMTGISTEREYLRDDKLVKMIVLELTDQSGKCECALFGDYVDELQRLIGNSSKGLPVVVIQFAKIKIFREKASLQNVMKTTRIFVDPKTEEAEALKKGLAIGGLATSSSVSIIGPRPRTSFEDDFLKLYPKKSIGQLESLSDEGTFVVCAVIDGFADGEKWWYPSCKCHRSVVADSGAFYCKGCDKHVYVTSPRYKVKANVFDGESFAVFVIFDGDMQYLIQKQCSALVVSVRGENAGLYPSEFDDLKGMKLLFKIEKKVSPSGRFDGSYRVKRVCKEASIVEAFDLQENESSPVEDITESGSSLTRVAENGIELSGKSESLKFAEDVLVTPNCAVLDESVGDSSDVVIVADENDSDTYVGMSAAKKRRLKKVNVRSSKRNLTDDFDEAISSKPNVALKVPKIEKE
ncbi:uncharacterized protein LOC123921661 [Trifolium pratense]|uniref:uncharacterized protein LOC123908197 n=1 Tax=Trifolium pratense TaxID=57577 RepID=UPI001E6943A2|nr:uncharacterized protein LOC123908197 [Trifolium pratense]XP_045830254.1 uncharacterized protein LOC123921661 [Trifolium pratense]